MDIHVLQGDLDMVVNCRNLAKFQVKGIPPAAAGRARARVTFQICGRHLESDPHEVSTGVGQEIEVQPTTASMTRWLKKQAALDNAEGDVRGRQLKTAQVEADRMLMSLKRAMETGGSCRR